MSGKDLSLGDFVKQLAVLMNKSGLVMLFKEEKPWHVLFYRLKHDEAPGKPQFFSTLRFDWDGPYPKSQELSRFIQALHWTGAVGAVNPSYETIVLHPEMSEFWSAMLKDFPGETQEFLKHAVTVAKEEFPSEAVTMK